MQHGSTRACLHHHKQEATISRARRIPSRRDAEVERPMTVPNTATAGKMRNQAMRSARARRWFATSPWRMTAVMKIHARQARQCKARNDAGDEQLAGGRIGHGAVDNEVDARRIMIQACHRSQAPSASGIG